MEAQAQMKYHHLERCFTYRMKRPMVFPGSSGFGPSRFGIYKRSALSREAGCEFRFVTFAALLFGLAQAVAREDPTVLKTAPIESPSGGSRVLFRDICQMGSLAGAAYLLHDNAGVLRQAQWEQKSHVAHKRKGLLD